MSLCDLQVQPDIGVSTQDLELFQQAVAAHLEVHPCFVDLVNRSLPEGTATKSELAQVCKHVDTLHAKRLQGCIPFRTEKFQKL